MATFQQKYFPR